MTGSQRVALAALAIGLSLIAGCSDGGAEAESAPSAAPSSTTAPAAPTTQPTEVGAPPTATPAAPEPADGEPRTSYLSIPAIGLRALEVEPYVGRTDDGPGTEIQDRGNAASPHGAEGGTGPGGIGNFQITAHRNSAGGPFFDLPELAVGARVTVTAAATTYVYEIVETHETSFRSAASLRAQRAAVPGRPGVAPTQAMITLSTCATQEDHAAGNYWADEFDNPEHRIDKIGVLVETRPA